MLAIQMMAMELAEPGDPELTQSTCAVTGIETRCVVRRRDLFSATFCDQDLLTAPSSPVVDARVAEVLGRGELRYASWTWRESTGWAKADKAAVRALVRGQVPSEPWACYAAPDMRRHGGLLTHVVVPGEEPVIQFGIERCRVSIASEVYERIEPLHIEKWMSRTRLTEWDVDARAIEKLGLARFLELERWARSKKNSGEWRLACFALPTIEEIKAWEQERSTRSPSTSTGAASS